MLDASPYAGPIGVTLAYVLVYYAFMGRVAVVKKRLAREYEARGEKFDRYFSQDRTMLAADRTQLNVLEHMGPFLVLLWLNAVFVSVPMATVVGALYVVSRALYPLVMGGNLGRDVRNSILLVTGPGYLIVAWFTGTLVWALVT